jgi:hypothetical protein
VLADVILAHPVTKSAVVAAKMRMMVDLVIFAFISWFGLVSVGSRSRCYSGPGHFSQPNESTSSRS